MPCTFNWLLANDDVLPVRVERLKGQANAYFEQKQYSSAIALYSEAMIYAPHVPVLYANRAAAYCKRGWGGDVGLVQLLSVSINVHDKLGQY